MSACAEARARRPGMRRFERVDETSDNPWEITVDGMSFEVRWSLLRALGPRAQSQGWRPRVATVMHGENCRAVPSSSVVRVSMRPAVPPRMFGPLT